MKPNPYFSPNVGNIAQEVVFSEHFLKKRNTGCISYGRNLPVETKNQQEIDRQVRNAGYTVLASLLASLLLLFNLLLLSNIAAAKEKLVPVEASPLPSFALEDAWGEPFQNKDFANKWSVVTIGFASCPDVCPFILTNLKVVSNRLAQISRDNIEVVFVSVDPERDKNILADYVDHFGHNVTGITGEDSELQKLAKGIGAYYELEQPDSSGHYNVRHSAFAVVVSPKGEVVARLSPPLPALETAKFIANLMRSPG